METDWNQRYIDESTPWDSGEPSKELTRALDQKLIEPCRVLELGCGTGTNAIFLARAGFSVTAVDLSEEALRQARSKAEAAGVDALGWRDLRRRWLDHSGRPAGRSAEGR